jgi:putative flavoprotein involved in K+ transport
LNTEVDAALWATGYKDESDWVAIPEVKDERGRFIHRRGVSPVPNLYFIGRSWQWWRGSALFVRVGADASYQEFQRRAAQDSARARKCGYRQAK